MTRKIGPNFEDGNQGQKAMHMITLPPVMDRTTAGALIGQIDTALQQGASVMIEGRDVARIGQCGLQLLLSAQLTAHTRGAEMTVQASSAMVGAAVLAGLADSLEWDGNDNDQ
jgi:anti-anti-sigma regulatory factor